MADTLLLVNCAPRTITMFKNMFQGSSRFSLVSILTSQISQAMDSADAAKPTLSKTDAARSEIHRMLDDGDQSAGKATVDTSKKEGYVQPVNPTIILYSLDERADVAAAHMTQLRVACAFRDIPIIVLTSMSSSPLAKSLLDYGATDILIFPQEPEKITHFITQSIEPKGSRMAIPTAFINPFITATIDLLSTMARLDATRTSLYLKKNYRLFGDISAIMNFTGQINGSVVVCLGKELASEIVARIIGCKPSDITAQDLKEGVGELVNIIAGNAKAALAQTAYQHQIALPTVVSGYGHEIAHPRGAPCIVTVFKAGHQSFAVMVSVANLQ